MEQSIQTASNQKERLIWVEILRILACIAVITIHVVSLPYKNTDISEFNWKVYNFFKSISEFGVPVFLMFSGTFMLQKDIPIERIFKKYIKRITIAFLFWSMAYTVLEAYSNFRSYGSFPIEHAVEYFINGLAHFWYIYALIALYLITPFLRKIVTDTKLTVYFLALTFIFSFVFPRTINLLEYCNIWQNFFLADELSWILNKFNYLSVLQIVFYYVSGYFLSNAKISGKAGYIIYCSGALSVVLKVLLTDILSSQKGELVGLLIGRNTITTAFFAVSVYIFGKNILSKINFSEKSRKIILSLSTSTFSIYLMHIFVMICVHAVFGLDAYSFISVLSVPLTVTAIFVISYIVTLIIRKIPFLNKYIV